MTDIKRIILDALEAYKWANPYHPGNTHNRPNPKSADLAGIEAYLRYQNSVNEAIAWVKEAI